MANTCMYTTLKQKFKQRIKNKHIKGPALMTQELDVHASKVGNKNEDDEVKFSGINFQ